MAPMSGRCSDRCGWERTRADCLAADPLQTDRHGTKAGTTRWSLTARQFTKEYFQRYPKDRYMTEIESWRELQSDNVEFTIKRLLKPIDNVG
jgi:hypothetical protein